MSRTQQYDFNTADFNAVYEGGALLPGADIRGVPWDIGEAQPAVVELEQAGSFRGKVLDAGCGLGDNAIFLARMGYSVTAVDAASTAVERARERAGDIDVEFAVADCTSLSGYEDQFDTLLDSALYHTLSESDRKRLVAALHRAAKPGARLLVLCFADVPGGMPAPLAVPLETLHNDLTEAGWLVRSAQRSVFEGVAASTAKFLEEVDSRPTVNESGRTQLPVWLVEADKP